MIAPHHNISSFLLSSTRIFLFDIKMFLNKMIKLGNIIMSVAGLNWITASDLMLRNAKFN